MSRKSKAEYIGEKRRAYACASAAKRRQILDEVCETLCYTRKYVIKLMTGNVRYRERKGRGRTYSDHALANARRVWEAVGCPCTTYFVAELPRIVREYDVMRPYLPSSPFVSAEAFAGARLRRKPRSF